jgi:hypothetical protein
MAEPNTLFLAILGLILFLLGSTALLAGIVIASVFQAMAFVTIGDGPLITYYFFGVLFILRNGIDVLWRSGAPTSLGMKISPLYWLLIFVVITALGVLVLPLAFKGVMVYSPKLSIDDQYNNLTPLAFGSSHLNQFGQLLINALIFVIVWIRKVPPQAFLKALLWSLAFSIGFAFWQFFSHISGTYYPNDWLYTVSGWSIGNEQRFGIFPRINGVFLEPSTFATYLVGFLAFLLVWWVKRASWALLLSLVLCLACMALTLSTTAYLGIALIFVAVFFGFGLAQLLSGGWLNQTLFGILCMTLFLLSIALITTAVSPELRELLGAVLTEKDSGESFRFRLEADIQSLVMVWRTYGLGIGLGGNRPSSFLTLLLSNVGLLGLVSFVMFMISLSTTALYRMRKMGNPRFLVIGIAAVWALWATMGAKVLAQPDLSFAPLWIWTFFLASLCVSGANTQTTLVTRQA